MTNNGWHAIKPNQILMKNFLMLGVTKEKHFQSKNVLHWMEAPQIERFFIF